MSYNLVMGDLDKEISGIVAGFQPDFREPIVWPRETSEEVMQAIQESVNKGHPLYEAIGFQIEREGDALSVYELSEPKDPQRKKAYWEYKHAMIGYGEEVPALLWTTRLTEETEGDWRQHPEASIDWARETFGVELVRGKIGEILPAREQLELIRQDRTAFALLDRAYERMKQKIDEIKKQRGPQEADIGKRLVGWQAGIKRYKQLYATYQEWA